jgi:glucokinase
MRTIGLDLGGSKLLACLIGEDGQILARAIRPTGRATGPSEACGLIADAAGELRQAAGPFDAAGLGFPGQVDFAQGLIGGSVMLDGWLDVPLGDLVAEGLGVPCVVDNDVNCAALAELQQRPDESEDSMLFIAVGTGIGGAIILGKRLWRGHTGVAGEIGNVTIDRNGSRCWCGRRGCLNTSASGTAIERLLESGMSHASALEHAAVALGIGLANALNLLNPGLVVFGGGVARLGKPWLELVARTAREESFPEAGRCRFELARAGYEAGAVGAALLARELTTTASPLAPVVSAVPGDPALSAAPQSVP